MAATVVSVASGVSNPWCEPPRPSSQRELCFRAPRRGQSSGRRCRAVTGSRGPPSALLPVRVLHVQASLPGLRGAGRLGASREARQLVPVEGPLTRRGFIGGRGGTIVGEWLTNQYIGHILPIYWRPSVGDRARTGGESWSQPPLKASNRTRSTSFQPKSAMGVLGNWRHSGLPPTSSVLPW